MKIAEKFDLIARHIVAVKDLGGADRLFGGAMDFLAPGRLGDVLGIYGRVVHVGKTSISIEMNVLAEDPASGATREIVHTTFVFVAIDKWGKKTPIRRKTL